MTMTTGVKSVTLPVADQDRALRFYVDVLGFELRIDFEVWPGARLVEVVPPGSTRPAARGRCRPAQRGRPADGRSAADVLLRRPGRQRAGLPRGADVGRGIVMTGRSGLLDIAFTAVLGKVREGDTWTCAASRLGHDLRHPRTRQGRSAGTCPRTAPRRSAAMERTCSAWALESRRSPVASAGGARS